MSDFQILEVGCGKGRNAEVLQKRWKAKVVGIDVSSEIIETAKRLHPTVEFSVMSLESLDFSDKVFDRIYAIDVLEHVDDLIKSVDEIVRVLKPNGVLVVNVPAEKSEQWLLKIRPSYFEEMHHVRIFKVGEMEKLFSERGLLLAKYKRKGFIDHLLLYYLFKRVNPSSTQLGIGRWSDSRLGTILFALQTYTKPEFVFSTWLWLFPAWIVLIPLGFLINLIGDRFFPKSMYYEFIKH
ncbi:MAG: class I SAM-dependent methyltransferase [Candidatus Doudnabacteria bacterium]|nr:class I SAM-dependent methyltransferase [Candidatus Doudnabacteria bacterium]